jgi:hypothetical protein
VRSSADRLIVTFQSGTSDAQIADAHLLGWPPRRRSGRPLVNIGDANSFVDVSGAPSLADAVRAYPSGSSRSVRRGGWVMRIADTPNDPEPWRQPSLLRIDAPLAWGRTHGTPAGRIAILDTGINYAGSMPTRT